jgi:hypothetical protein
MVLRLSHASIYGLIRSGKLDALKVGNATRITRRSIEHLINSSPRVRDKLLAANEAEAAEPVHSPETGRSASNEHIEPTPPPEPRAGPPERGPTDAKSANRQHDHQALQLPAASRQRDCRSTVRGATGNCIPSGDLEGVPQS